MVRTSRGRLAIDRLVHSYGALRHGGEPVQNRGLETACEGLAQTI